MAWDGHIYRPASSRLVPDLRDHVANWSRFKKKTGGWPALSITTYVMRFMLMIGGLISASWYGAFHLSKTQVGVTCLVVLLFVFIVWSIVERSAWNRDLRRTGISSDQDIWGVTQFPHE